MIRWRWKRTLLLKYTPEGVIHSLPVFSFSLRCTSSATFLTFHTFQRLPTQCFFTAVTLGVFIIRSSRKELDLPVPVSSWWDRCAALTWSCWLFCLLSISWLPSPLLVLEQSVSDPLSQPALQDRQCLETPRVHMSGRYPVSLCVSGTAGGGRREEGGRDSGRAECIIIQACSGLVRSGGSRQYGNFI